MVNVGPVNATTHRSGLPGSIPPIPTLRDGRPWHFLEPPDFVLYHPPDIDPSWGFEPDTIVLVWEGMFP
jgi:hypothetical protein